MSLWRAILKCHDCHAVLNTAENVPEEAKGRVTISSALAAGKCHNGCRSTFSDANINTDLEWEELRSSGDKQP